MAVHCPRCDAKETQQEKVKIQNVDVPKFRCSACGTRFLFEEDVQFLIFLNTPKPDKK